MLISKARGNTNLFFGTFLVGVSFLILCTLLLNPSAHGPRCAEAQGLGMGRGLQRGYGYMRDSARPGCGAGPGGGPGTGPGYGAGRGAGYGHGVQRGCDLQMGIMNEPYYCRMLMDRPDLNLTSEQRESLRQLQIKHVKETADIRADLQINKIELRKLRFSKSPDFNAIKKQLEKISKLQLELQLSRAKLQLDADKILTEEQKNSLYLSPDMAVDIEWEKQLEEREE